MNFKNTKHPSDNLSRNGKKKQPKNTSERKQVLFQRTNTSYASLQYETDADTVL